MKHDGYHGAFVEPFNCLKYCERINFNWTKMIVSSIPQVFNRPSGYERSFSLSHSLPISLSASLTLLVILFANPLVTVPQMKLLAK